MRTAITVCGLLLAASPALAQMGAGNQPRDSFSNFDRDRNGVVTLEEAREADIEGRFAQMDQNGDGLVTEPEMNTMEAPGIGASEALADQINRMGSGQQEEPEREDVAEFEVDR